MADKKRSQKNEKAITLIALVITIIILLILAGISIATLTGENGILSKANIAKTETIKKSAEEKVQIAVMGSYATDGKIDLNQLNTNLRQVEGLTDIIFKNESIMNDGKITELPIEVVVDGYLIGIDGEGKVALKAIKPEVTHTISPETQVGEGEEITITIKASITEGTIVKITKPDGTEVKNVEETTYTVTENDDYEFIVEASNGEKVTYIVEIVNGKEVEKFSDIYTETKVYTDTTGKTVRIPEGFAVGTSKTIDKIENGLVITDKIDENHYSIGNEFVWVPVEKKEDFVRVPGYCNGSIQTSLPAGSWNNTSEPYTNGTQKEKDLYASMYNSVTDSKNKGFYMGRYETGKEEDNPVVKKGAKIYDMIIWGNSISQLSGGAFDLSINFTKDKIYEEKVTSCMVFGVQWDATLKFFDDEDYLKDSSGRGWYEAPLRPAGTNIDERASNRLKNIYDMAGNAMELTMEAQWDSSLKKMFRIPRGGGTSWRPGSTCPASYRGYTEGSSQGGMGFRITLFFKD